MSFEFERRAVVGVDEIVAFAGEAFDFGRSKSNQAGQRCRIKPLQHDPLPQIDRVLRPHKGIHCGSIELERARQHQSHVIVNLADDDDQLTKQPELLRR